MQKQPLTREQAKARIKSQGIPITEWARRNGFTPRQVTLVLNGQLKGNFGKAHEVAVKLGLKADDQQAA